MRNIELLIPARDLEAGKAAVDHGADAVYIGGPAFGARAAAGNPVTDIARLAEYAHPYGVKVYAALNTLVYENELQKAESIARELLSAGVDALIIQDPAYLMMGLDGAVFHASTQMCNTTPEKVEFLARSGFSRVVLERGLSIAQVEEINRRCDVETECFIHGAICVGHSGQCYLSRSMGPRSGNRGECSQPCRLRYDLTDDKGGILAADKYLLSVRDLNLSERVSQLIDAGVMSFKVEGRLKETGYVKNITAFYRGVLDAEIARRPDLRKSSVGVSRYGFTPDPAKSFSRGFTVWTADGQPKNAASFFTPKALGQPAGKVAQTAKDHFTLSGNSALSAGDGICFFHKGELVGTNINRTEGRKVYPNKMNSIFPGVEIYRNYDHGFNRLVERSRTSRYIPVQIECAFRDGVLAVSAADCTGLRAEAFAAGTHGPAADRDRMLSLIETQMRKTGETIYETGEFSWPAAVPDGIPFFPVSALNALRREVFEKLTRERLRAFANRKKEAALVIPREDNFPCTSETLGGGDNVSNPLARRFWEMHGVRSFETAYDLRPSLDGEKVMTTPHCLRRELGICLKEKPESPPRTLFLRTGNHRYRLSFDCNKCLMELTYTTTALFVKRAQKL